MSITFEDRDPSNAPTIMPHSATFPGMLRDEPMEGLTLEDFQRLLLGRVETLRVRRVIETGEWQFVAYCVDDIGQGLWAFACGHEKEQPRA